MPRARSGPVWKEGRAYDDVDIKITAGPYKAEQRNFNISFYTSLLLGRQTAGNQGAGGPQVCFAVRPQAARGSCVWLHGRGRGRDPTDRRTLLSLQVGAPLVSFHRVAYETAAILMATPLPKRSLLDRRKIARDRTVRRGRFLMNPFSSDRHALSTNLDEWNRSCEAFFKAQRCCSYCGYLAFAGSWTWDEFKIERPTSAVAPYAVDNCFMSKFCATSDKQGWYVCGCCSKSVNRERRARFVVFMTPAYVRLLLTPHPLELQRLSVLDVRIDTYRHFRGFVHGSMQETSLLDSPFVLTHLLI